MRLRTYVPADVDGDFTDLYCGAGGSSAGLEEAGLRGRIALNHWLTAIETHKANKAHMEHRCENINQTDMRSLPRTRILWASPICTEASPAGGKAKGKRRPKGQLDLFEEDGHVEQAGFERTRATFHDVIRATEYHRYDVVIVENVVNVAWEWELFDWWVNGMKLLGYNCQFVSASSAHLAGPGNPHAPQWRDRLYMVFSRVGMRLPDVAPRPLSWCPACEALVEAFQSWKKLDGPNIGKYRSQYVYRCPRTECRHAIAEPVVAPAVTAIDWTDLGTPIGDRPKTANKPEGLAPSTMTRIRAGESLIGQPVMVVQAGGNTYERPGSGYVRAWSATDQPLTARTGTAGDAIVSDPALATALNYGLVVPVGGNNHDAPGRMMLDPMCTRVARDTDALVLPPAFYMKNFGGNCRPEDTVGHITSPFGAITGRDHHSLVVPYRKGRATTTAEPFHTMATRDSAALVRTLAQTDVSEWLFRMLKAREHLNAQRFPFDYIVKGNVSEQTMQAGNAVSVNAAHWLGAAVAAVL